MAGGGGGAGLQIVTHSETNTEVPIPEKPEVDESLPKNVIKYEDRIFEVPYEVIDYLAQLPDVLEARIQRAQDNGMSFMYPDGTAPCHYCNHYTKNIANLHLPNSFGVHTQNYKGEQRADREGCQYEKAEPVTWVREFKDKDSDIIVLAQIPPCAITDSKLAILVERGLLDEYEVLGTVFDYPTLSELGETPDLIEKFKVEPHRMPVKIPPPEIDTTDTPKSLYQRVAESIRNLLH